MKHSNQVLTNGNNLYSSQVNYPFLTDYRAKKYKTAISTICALSLKNELTPWVNRLWIGG